MLDTKTIEIIKSTVPVLEKHGEDITKTFYKLMFTNHPELLNIFNHANQKQGRQQKALANSVYATAKYIDNLEAIIPVVTQIAHKHRSLGIKPEHYPIVGEHLILAIKEVLKEAATEEIIDAWVKAYGVIADAFIGFEKSLYEDAAHKPGGWDDFRTFTVAKKVKESDVITSFYFTPADGGNISGYFPGQYISLKLTIPGEEYTHIRQYSLSDSPEKSYYRISVKKEEGNSEKPDGKVSSYLHNELNEGDCIEISAPAGEFVLENVDKPVVLLSGGVGITPMHSMLRHLDATGVNHETIFVHAALNGNVQAFTDEVHEIAKNNPLVKSYFCYENPTDKDKTEKVYSKEGYITSEWLKTIVPNKESMVYMCGPVPFMQAMYEALLDAGFKKENIRYEFFGPSMQLKETQSV
ncbi:NO-inducible flavohemoprotein [Cytobacillus firmus]|uniref:NO-inducible flavohemoprotein n=1 Tax=Cytobacillus firmus TaxID=1399 RepID=UPI0018CF582C|nr:NO-inducible flavohemoprotein [Cytobacillus firmus]MBG9550183.1 dihydropteridine reductase [Cytobacillus firmus]MBG9601968.1 dihydropteridine reductase [Cytobacillus firmus]MED1941320.1 NO-inducible flavohemoprotein [Cytobacillus firmus]